MRRAASVRPCPGRIGIRRHPTDRKAMATRVNPSPTGRKANISYGWPRICWSTVEMMRLGEVPIRVIMPPTRDANDIGMSSSDIDRFACRASCMATGRKIASAPMFFMTADRNATQVTRKATCAVAEVRYGRRGRSAAWISPELRTAVLRTSADAISGKSEFLNPSNAFSTGMMPAASAVRSVSRATRSKRSRSQRNRTSMPPMMARQRAWGRVTFRSSGVGRRAHHRGRSEFEGKNRGKKAIPHACRPCGRQPGLDLVHGVRFGEVALGPVELDLMDQPVTQLVPAFERFGGRDQDGAALIAQLGRKSSMGFPFNAETDACAPQAF